MFVEQSVVCPALVGRAAPLSTVFHTLDRARAAHGGTLLVSGEAGIGKSRLVRAMAERARSLGFVVLQGACFEADRARCASEVSLRPLDVADVSAMLQAIFGADAAFGASFLDGLHDLTEGNPFFVEEMLKALLVAGDLRQVDGAWRARPLEHVRVP